ncbi:MAG: adenylyl-sulfate kinase [Verrucomicrobiota bacterium]|nr:adenylyl-sulfate kinase [Verrucomicrobiota bacterium]
MTKVFWLFGRSGAGKTTLAKRLCRALEDRKVPVFYLDGDEMRSGLCSDLGFTPESRMENHRRVAEVVRLAAQQGLTVVSSTMAPQHCQRDVVAHVLGNRLVWIYVHAPLDVCIQRDPKGLYRRAQAGQLDKLLNFPFEVPRPQERENFIDTVAQNVDGCSRDILELAQACLSDFVI